MRQLRLFSLSCLFLASLALAAPLSHAAPALSPMETIHAAVDDIMDVIKRPELTVPEQREEMLRQVEAIAYTVFDFEEFSARTVGIHWRSFTPDQKNRFIEAFSSLLRAMYVDKLKGYGGEQVEFLKEIKSTKGDKAEVQTTVRIQDKAVPVAYRLLVKGDAWKVYDVIIEQMSLVENYRGQFKEIIGQSDAEALIARVEAKAEEARQQNQAGQ